MESVVCCIKIHTVSEFSSVLLLCLVQILMKQTLVLKLLDSQGYLWLMND